MPNGPEVKQRTKQESSRNKKAEKKRKEKKWIELCVRCHPLCWIVWLVCWMLDIILLKFLCPKAPWFSNHYPSICSHRIYVSRNGDDTRCGMYDVCRLDTVEWHLFKQLQKITLELFKLQNRSGRYSKKSFMMLKSHLKCSRLSPLNASNWIPHQMVQIYCTRFNAIDSSLITIDSHEWQL